MAKGDLLFPKDFLWGTATAAHQVEGDNCHNNWWRFEEQPGRIKNGDRSGRACDHWNRYRQDFALLSGLQQNAYRLSVEWSRLYPEPGKLDKKALARYVDMIDQLLKRKIEPFVTLLHFTVPAWWEDRGGFQKRSREHLDHFTEFCAVVAESFKGKVRYWNTVNEITIAMLGFLTGFFPPGEGRSFIKAGRAVNTLLAMHNAAYETVKRVDPSAQVGLVHNIQMVRPLYAASIQDRMLSVAVDFLFNGSVLRGIKKGKLVHGARLAGLKGSSDFIGLNFYNFMQVSRSLPDLVRSATDNPLCGADKLCAGIGWEPYPEGLYLALRRLHDTFPGLPVYITENGIGTDDDRWRQKVLIDHLRMVHRAIQEGVDVRGYFHWSLMDNFEWAQGFSSRFGLIGIDYRTQKRTVKGSGRLYGEIARRNGLSAALLKKFPGDIYRPRL